MMKKKLCWKHEKALQIFFILFLPKYIYDFARVTMVFHMNSYVVESLHLGTLTLGVDILL